MKAGRVYVTLGLFGAAVLAFFVLPLPVSRVHDTGYVSLDPGFVEPVLLPEPARLTALEVQAGQWVRGGQVLARFSSEPLQVELEQAHHKADERFQAARQLRQTLTEAEKGVDRDQLENFRRQMQEAEAEATTANNEIGRLRAQLARVRELKAPRDGYITTVPRRDEVGKTFDRGTTEAQPFCTVGDLTKLVIKVPVSPQDFRVLKDDLPPGGELPVSVHFHGRSDKVFAGRVRYLPEQNARTVPVQLTQQGGGPLAVQPSNDPNQLAPLSQTYLIDVEVADPDAAIKPGGFAVVKIHAKWRSAAWWVGRAISNALDIGLY